MVLNDRDVGIPWMFSSSTLHRSKELAHVVCADYVTYAVIVMIMCVDRDDNARL